MEIYQLNETGFWSDFSTSEYLTKLGLSTVNFILLHVFFFGIYSEMTHNHLHFKFELLVTVIYIGGTAAPFVIV